MSIKNNFIFSLVFLIFLCMLSLAYAACPNSMLGDGSVNNPCNITSWADLDAVRDDLTLNYQLVANLSKDTTGYAGIGDDWQPIGNEALCDGSVGATSEEECLDCDWGWCGSEWIPENAFRTNFNGKNNYINDLKTNTELTFDVGLFGYINNAKLTNANIYNFNITGIISNGGIIGTATNSYINNIKIEGIIDSSQYGTVIGGLIGYIKQNMSINNIYSNMTIYGNFLIGGLIGGTEEQYNYYNYINNSFTYGNIYGEYGTFDSFEISGFVDRCYNTIINNSYSNINIFNTTNAGGITGLTASRCDIYNTYSIGYLTPPNNGGFTGEINSANLIISNSYFDINTTNHTNSNGGGETLKNATGKTTAQMKNISTYVGWNISKSAIDMNNGYPYLAWQIGNTSATWLIYDASLAPTPPSNTTTKNDQLIQAVSSFPALLALLITIIFVAFMINLLNGNIAINNLDSDTVLKAVFVIVLSAMMFGILILVYNYLPLS